MKNVDNSIRVRNLEWDWPQKVNSRKRRKIFTKMYKLVQGQECSRKHCWRKKTYIEYNMYFDGHIDKSEQLSEKSLSLIQVSKERNVKVI